jgi:hypothetical protein
MGFFDWFRKKQKPGQESEFQKSVLDAALQDSRVQSQLLTAEVRLNNIMSDLKGFLGQMQTPGREEYNSFLRGYLRDKPYNIESMISLLNQTINAIKTKKPLTNRLASAEILERTEGLKNSLLDLIKGINSLIIQAFSDEDISQEQLKETTGRMMAYAQESCQFLKDLSESIHKHELQKLLATLPNNTNALECIASSPPLQALIQTAEGSVRQIFIAFKQMLDDIISTRGPSALKTAIETFGFLDPSYTLMPGWEEREALIVRNARIERFSDILLHLQALYDTLWSLHNQKQTGGELSMGPYSKLPIEQIRKEVFDNAQQRRLAELLNTRATNVITVLDKHITFLYQRLATMYANIITPKQLHAIINPYRQLVNQKIYYIRQVASALEKIEGK